MKKHEWKVPNVFERLGLKNAQEMNYVFQYVQCFDMETAGKRSGFTSMKDVNALHAEERIKKAIETVCAERFRSAQLSAEEVMWALWRNHEAALANGNIGASNTALHLLMKHGAIDALSAEKIQVESADEKISRILRGQKRANASLTNEAVDDLDSSGDNDLTQIDFI